MPELRMPIDQIRSECIELRTNIKKKTKNIDSPLDIFPARVPREKQYENSPIFLQLDVLFIYILAYLRSFVEFHEK